MPWSWRGWTRGMKLGTPCAAAKPMHLLLQALELLQGDVKEVAGAAGGIEHLDAGQPVEEVAHVSASTAPCAAAWGRRVLWGGSRRRGRYLPRSCRSRTLTTISRHSSHSRRSGCMTTGSTSVSMSSRLVKWAPICERLSGSRPRSNRVPKTAGSTSLQSALAARRAAQSLFGRSSTAASLNRLPLKRLISSGPKYPPEAIASKRRESIGRRRVGSGGRGGGPR